jgi:hypothetical protein
MSSIDRLYREERQQADESNANPVWAAMTIGVIVVVILGFLQASRDAETSVRATTYVAIVDLVVSLLVIAFIALVYHELRLMNETWRKWFHWTVLMDVTPEEDVDEGEATEMEPYQGRTLGGREGHGPTGQG